MTRRYTTMIVLAMVIAFFAIVTMATQEEQMCEKPQMGNFPPESVMQQYRNIYFENLQVSGTAAIVAARSQSNPNYWFDWVRDSAVSIGAAQRILGFNSTEIAAWYERYEYNNQLQFKSQPNPGFDIRGDVKFEVDGRVFTGPWGRNQNDGPASRVSIRIDYANYLLARGQQQQVQNLYRSGFEWGGIKWELDYVMRQWSTATFDIWEECNGFHFYTLMVSRRALYKGAVLAYQLGDYDFALELLFQAAAINNAIPQHFNDKDGYIFPMIKTVCPDDRDSMDIAIQLATLYGRIEPQLMIDVQGITKAWYNGMCTGSGPLDSRCSTMKSYIDNWTQYGDAYWTQPRPHHSYNLFSLWRLSEWSRQNFNIAKQYPAYKETLIARYAWDKYDGYGKSIANPWFLANFATSQVWTAASKYFKQVVNDPFEPNFTFYPVHYYMWADFHQYLGGQCPPVFLNTLRNGKVYTIPKNSFITCANALSEMFNARAIDAVNHPFQFIGYANNVSEQLHRDYGTAVGANYLTWSYSSLHNSWYDYVNRANPLV